MRMRETTLRAPLLRMTRKSPGSCSPRVPQRGITLDQESMGGPRPSERPRFLQAAAFPIAPLHPPPPLALLAANRNQADLSNQALEQRVLQRFREQVPTAAIAVALGGLLCCVVCPVPLPAIVLLSSLLRNTDSPLKLLQA